MPALPTRVAATAERWFGRPATVTTATDLSPGLRHVTLDVPDLARKHWEPGRDIEFRVSEREFRHYTAMNIDPATGAVDVVFGLTATGPGTAWARRLQPGDQIGLMGPGGGLKRPGDAARELFLGDATALGLGAALLRENGPLTGAVEVPPADLAAAADLLPGLDVLAAGPTPGGALATWLEGHLQPTAGSSTLLPERACLVGHAQSIQHQRELLRTAGMTRRSIVTKAYWATGRRGL